MKELVSSIDVQDICTSDDVNLLFRAGDGNTPLDKLFFAVAEAPPISGTQRFFISFWDKNVRDVLELLLPSGRSMRDSSRHTATGNLRPDYAFILNKLCPFRGEEKAPDSPDDPKKELVEKLAWAYSPAPYVLGELKDHVPLIISSLITTLTGYYATGPNLTLVAISPPSKPRGRPVVHDIVSANLKLRKDRIKNICRLINLSGFFQALADLVRPSDAEFEVLERFFVPFISRSFKV